MLANARRVRDALTEYDERVQQLQDSYQPELVAASCLRRRWGASALQSGHVSGVRPGAVFSHWAELVLLGLHGKINEMLLPGSLEPDPDLEITQPATASAVVRLQKDMLWAAEHKLLSICLDSGPPDAALRTGFKQPVLPRYGRRCLLKKELVYLNANGNRTTSRKKNGSTDYVPKLLKQEAWSDEDGNLWIYGQAGFYNDWPSKDHLDQGTGNMLQSAATATPPMHVRVMRPVYLPANRTSDDSSENSSDDEGSKPLTYEKWWLYVGLYKVKVPEKQKDWDKVNLIKRFQLVGVPGEHLTPNEVKQRVQQMASNPHALRGVAMHQPRPALPRTGARATAAAPKPPPANKAALPPQPPPMVPPAPVPPPAPKANKSPPSSKPPPAPIPPPAPKPSKGPPSPKATPAPIPQPAPKPPPAASPSPAAAKPTGVVPTSTAAAPAAKKQAVATGGTHTTKGTGAAAQGSVASTIPTPPNNPSAKQVSSSAPSPPQGPANGLDRQRRDTGPAAALALDDSMLVDEPAVSPQQTLPGAAPTGSPTPAGAAFSQVLQQAHQQSALPSPSAQPPDAIFAGVGALEQQSEVSIPSLLPAPDHGPVDFSFLPNSPTPPVPLAILPAQAPEPVPADGQQQKHLKRPAAAQDRAEVANGHHASKKVKIGTESAAAAAAATAAGDAAAIPVEDLTEEQQKIQAWLKALKEPAQKHRVMPDLSKGTAKLPVPVFWDGPSSTARSDEIQRLNAFQYLNKEYRWADGVLAQVWPVLLTEEAITRTALDQPGPDITLPSDAGAKRQAAQAWWSEGSTRPFCATTTHARLFRSDPGNAGKNPSALTKHDEARIRPFNEQGMMRNMSPRMPVIHQCNTGCTCCGIACKSNTQLMEGPTVPLEIHRFTKAVKTNTTDQADKPGRASSDGAWGVSCPLQLGKGRFVCLFLGELTTPARLRAEGTRATDPILHLGHVMALWEWAWARGIKGLISLDRTKDARIHEFPPPPTTFPPELLRLTSVDACKEPMGIPAARPPAGNPALEDVWRQAGACSATPKEQECFSPTTLLVVDARRAGNVARFMRHSSNPNLHVQLVYAGGARSACCYYLALYAADTIKENTELTYDHNHLAWIVANAARGLAA